MGYVALLMEIKSIAGTAERMNSLLSKMGGLHSVLATPGYVLGFMDKFHPERFEIITSGLHDMALFF